MRAKRAWFESECCEVNNRTWKPVLLATFWPKHKVNFQPPPPNRQFLMLFLVSKIGHLKISLFWQVKSDFFSRKWSIEMGPIM